MRKPFNITLALLLISIACVDRLDKYDFSSVAASQVVVDGSITDQPGPYQVKLTRAFDIESRITPRVSLSARRLTISDNFGITEVLKEIKQGVYETSATGIRGQVGRIYTLKVELLDGRIYESKPDTLYPTGRIDSMFYKFNRITVDDSVTRSGFDVYFNATTAANRSAYYLWKFKGTFKVKTNPELYDTLCADARCPKPLPCSGYVNRNSNEIEYRRPCECCTCWVDFFNDDPVISDQTLLGGQMNDRHAAFIPITQWTFMYKVRAELRQLSLSAQTYRFWKAVADQKDAQVSLFQPVTGKIPSNFVQLSGEQTAIAGLFYATSISIAADYVSFEDFPKMYVPPAPDPPIKNSCIRAFANSRTQRPDFWVD